MIIKQLGKALLSRRLEAQVKQLLARNDLKIIAVVGSVGKTSTKMAIATILQPQARVQFQRGNYNDRLTVPLVFFGQTQPGIFNVVGWLRVLGANKRMLKRSYDYDVVVVELGSDGPGQLQHFAYLHPDITVVCAITEEHMEFFKTIDAVAQEELTPLSYSKQTLINVDDSPAQYLQGRDYNGYGQAAADYKIISRQVITGGQQTVRIRMRGAPLECTTGLVGEQGAKITAAAAAVADLYGLSPEHIANNAANITAFAGRMQLLPGVQGSTIIDDTYNASPAAVKAALDALYEMTAPQKIALIGNMGEMGEHSAAMHTDVGNYCDPAQLDYVLTLSLNANSHLAPAAVAKGCTVKTFTSPYEAGEFLKAIIRPGAAILVKGSQNRVFSEEAIKSILANPADANKLVRQSEYWLDIKQKQFIV